MRRRTTGETDRLPSILAKDELLEQLTFAVKDKVGQFGKRLVDDELRRAVTKIFDEALAVLLKQGRVAAYVVKCDASTTTKRDLGIEVRVRLRSAQELDMVPFFMPIDHEGKLVQWEVDERTWQSSKPGESA